MSPRTSGRFTVRPVKSKARGFAYETFQVSGWLNGQRVRRNLKDREKALGEKNRLEVECSVEAQP